MKQRTRKLQAGLGVMLIGFIISMSGLPATAQPAGDCAIPPGYAATLLFPYFEVDLNDPGGVTTLISINNALASDVLTRVVVWTDWGVPTLAFDIWLGGFDVQTVSLRNVLDGNIPSTGAGEDLSAYQFCGSLPPDHVNPVLDAFEVESLQADHTGNSGPGSVVCTGAFYGDNVARGYITVDTVDECSGVEYNNPIFTPANDTWPYFNDGGMVNSIATNSNQIWGDFVFVDFTGKAAQGSQAVPLWASPSQHPGPDAYTFYGRFHNWDGRDHRVPLPYRWDQRFLNGGVFGGGADLIVWRDPEVPTSGAVCGFVPAPFPLTTEATALDEDRSVTPLADTHFPLVTQRVGLDTLGIPYDFGWIQIDTFLPGGDVSQAWVESTLTSSAFELSAAWPGTPVEDLCGFDPSIN